MLDQPLAKGAFAHDDAPIQILQPCVPRVAERVMRPPPVSAVIQGNGVVSATLYIGCIQAVYRLYIGPVGQSWRRGTGSRHALDREVLTEMPY